MQLVQLMLGLAISGAVLIGLEHRVHSKDSKARGRDWIKYAVYLGYLSVLLGARYLGWWPAVILIATVVAAASYELRRLWPHHSMRWLGVSTLVLVGLAHLLLMRGPEGRALWSGAVLFVAVSDSFAQLIGKLVGHHQLCPRLSPGKTVEGLIGGLAAALGLAIAAPFLLPGLSLTGALVLAGMSSIAAVVGDLSFSWIKRRFGLKDFADWIPEHGGILDRVDSLVLGAPVFYWGWHFLDASPTGI